MAPLASESSPARPSHPQGRLLGWKEVGAYLPESWEGHMKTPGKMWWMTRKQAELRFAGEITWHLIQALSSGLALGKLLRPL